MSKPIKNPTKSHNHTMILDRTHKVPKRMHMHTIVCIQLYAYRYAYNCSRHWVPRIGNGTICNRMPGTQVPLPRYPGQVPLPRVGTTTITMYNCMRTMYNCTIVSSIHERCTGTGTIVTGTGYNCTHGTRVCHTDTVSVLYPRYPGTAILTLCRGQTKTRRCWRKRR